MKTALLVAKLQARNIRLSIGENDKLVYDADEPIPTGIRTTLEIEAARIVKYLASQTQQTVDAGSTYKNASARPQTILQKFGNDTPMFKKVLEFFPLLGSIKWSPNDELRKVRQ